MSIHTRIIGNAFRLAGMTPGLEAAIGREMLAVVGRERKRVDMTQAVYAKPVFEGEVYDAARATVLRLLAEGPMYARDMLGSVRLAESTFSRLLGAMRMEGAITGEPKPGRAALWSLP